MMNPWLLVLLLFSILILLLLLTPIKYEIGFAYHDDVKLFAGIRQGYWFRLIIAKDQGRPDFKLRIFNIRLPLSREGKQSKPAKPPKPQSRSASPLAVFSNIVRNKTYRPLGKLFGRLFRDIRPEHFRLKGQYGFSEPHYTAWLYTLLLLLSSDSPNYRIQPEPVWDDEILDIEGDIQGSITLAGITWHLIRFLLSPSLWRFLIDLRRDKKKKQAKAKLSVQPSA